MVIPANMAPPEPPAQQRYGVPQVIAVLLLLAFLGQGLWRVARTPASWREMAYAVSWDQELKSFHQRMSANLLREGLNQEPEGIRLETPLTALMARAALLRPSFDASRYRLMRLPFLIFGTLLGASLWYVARRLYGNAGGYIALCLYAFSPAILHFSCSAGPEIATAWPVFGTVFTAIAVAHTLYAPREVVLWNWRRILLLGTAIGVGAGAEFASVVTVVFALAFMLYLAPERRGAALAIIGAALGTGMLIWWALERFRIRGLFSGLGHFALAGFAPRAILSAYSARLLLDMLLAANGPGFAALLAVALGAFVVWRRTRFFGTMAPLCAGSALIVVGLAFPGTAAPALLLAALPFLFTFIAGVCADLVQSRYAPLAKGVIAVALLMNASSSLYELWMASR
jgi:hypothetical protein